MEAGRTWWYVCTLCNRATPHETESQDHKFSEHQGVRSANILVLSQAEDLSPCVRIPKCGPLTPLLKRMEIGVDQLPQPPATATDEDSDSEELEWKCKLCPTSCATETHLKAHVLVHHVPGGAGSDEVPIVTTTADTVKEALPEDSLDFDLADKEELENANYSGEVTRTLRPRAPKLTAASVDDDTDPDSSDCELDLESEFDQSESESDWTDQEAEEIKGQRNSEIRLRRTFPEEFPIPVFKAAAANGNSDTDRKKKICGVCYRPQKNVEALNNHVRKNHADHLLSEKYGGPCDCLICYQDAFLRPSTIYPGMFECKICDRLDTPDRSTIKIHVRGRHPELQLPVQSWSRSAPPSEWRKAKEDFLKMTGKVKPIPQQNSEGRYECPICNKTYERKDQWTFHLTNKHRAPTTALAAASRTCSTCKQVFSCAKDLKRHRNSVHQGNVNGDRDDVTNSSADSNIKSESEFDQSEPEADCTDEEAKETRAKPRQRNRNSGNSDTKKKICGVCYRPQKKVKTLNQHVRKYHSDHLRNQKSGAPCDCLICYQDAFLRPSTIFPGMFECKICDHLDSQSNKCGIRNHVRKCHPDHQLPPPWGATISEWRKAKEDYLKMPGEVKQRNSDGRYECTICNKTYARKDQWTNHFTKKHRRPRTATPTNRTCPTCKQVFSCTTYLKEHQKCVHQDSRDHLCSTCGSTFKSLKRLKAHSLRHDPANKIHKCDTCGKTCLRKEDLQRHKYTHAPRTYLCPECGLLFKSALALLTHQKGVHLKLRPFKCDQCDERFRTQSARNRHMAKHLDSKTFKCTLCSGMYKTSIHLSTHVNREHRKEKERFICKFCQKEFRGQVTLRSHELEVHDYEHVPGMRYKCKHCDKQFMREFNLKSHEKAHSDERSYSCPVPDCGKKFKLSSHLHQHKFSHMAYEELPHVCEVEGCGKRFGVPGQLRSHKQRVHGMEGKANASATKQHERDL